MKRKTPLRDKIFWIGNAHQATNLRKFTDSILRLIRAEQKRKCEKCGKNKEWIRFEK